jgi:hypothetical protein
MKKLASGLTSFSLLCLLSAGALADHKDLKEHVTINEKIFVNGTKVKPGRYLVRYNANTGEMQLEMSGKVVAQAKATVVINNDKFDQDALLTRTTASGTQLTGIRLGGQHEEIQLADVSASIDQEEETVDILFIDILD